MTNDFVLSEFEMAQLGNLLPSTSEEAKFYIPRYEFFILITNYYYYYSLKNKIDDDSLQRLLDDISSYINQQ